MDTIFKRQAAYSLRIDIGWVVGLLYRLRAAAGRQWRLLFAKDCRRTRLRGLVKLSRNTCS